MREIIIQLQVGMGVIVGLIIVGWCIYRLLLLTGWIKKKRAKVPLTKGTLASSKGYRLPSKRELYTGKRRNGS